jgi:hypothetical protein
MSAASGLAYTETRGATTLLKVIEVATKVLTSLRLRQYDSARNPVFSIFLILFSTRQATCQLHSPCDITRAVSVST